MLEVFVLTFSLVMVVIITAFFIEIDNNKQLKEERSDIKRNLKYRR